MFYALAVISTVHTKLCAQSHGTKGAITRERPSRVLYAEASARDLYGSLVNARQMQLTWQCRGLTTYQIANWMQNKQISRRTFHIDSHDWGRESKLLIILLQDDVKIGVIRRCSRPRWPRRGLTSGQAWLPGLRLPRDPAGAPDILRESGGHVVARRHLIHHARWKVRSLFHYKLL